MSNSIGSLVRRSSRYLTPDIRWAGDRLLLFSSETAGRAGRVGRLGTAADPMSPPAGVPMPRCPTVAEEPGYLARANNPARTATTTVFSDQRRRHPGKY